MATLACHSNISLTKKNESGFGYTFLEKPELAQLQRCTAYDGNDVQPMNMHVLFEYVNSQALILLNNKTPSDLD